MATPISSSAWNRSTPIGEKAIEVEELLGCSLLPEELAGTENIEALPVQETLQKYRARLRVFLALNQLLSKTDDESRAKLEALLPKLKSEMGLLNGINEHKADSPLEEHQTEAMEALQVFLESGRKRGYVKMPPRTGKTVVFMDLLRRTLQPGKKTLIVTDKRILVNQTAAEAGEFCPGKSVGRIYTGADERDRDLTVITYNSFRRRVKSGDINPDDYDYLVLDEVHKALGPVTTETVDKFTKSRVIGFSATTEYDEEHGVKKLLPHEIHRLETKRAIEMGALCDYSTMLVETGVDLSEVGVNSKGEYFADELQALVNTEPRNRAAIEIYKRYFDGQRGIMSCAGVQHAKDLAKAFNDAGIKAEVVHGGTKNVDDILDEFKAETGTKVVTNHAILLEGYDDPGLSFIFNLRPTRSKVVGEQRGTRPMTKNRKDPSKNHCWVVEFLDVLDGKMAPIFLEEIIQDKTEDRAIRDIAIEAREALDEPGYSVTTNGKLIQEAITRKNKAKLKAPRASAREALPKAPEGWESLTVMAKALGMKPIHRDVLNNIKEAFFETEEGEPLNETLMSAKYSERDRQKENIHVHPTLAAYMRKVFRGEIVLFGKLPPEGWLSIEPDKWKQLKVKNRHNTVQRPPGIREALPQIIALVLADDPALEEKDLTGLFHPGPAIRREDFFCHPVLIEKIKAIAEGQVFLADRLEPPEGWLNEATVQVNLKNAGLTLNDREFKALFEDLNKATLRTTVHDSRSPRKWFEPNYYYDPSTVDLLMAAAQAKWPKS